MLVVGLTGGIGSGKSTVAELLAHKGAVVVDADVITRELQQPGTPVFEAMVERFGTTIVAPDGTLDRPAVAEIVFDDAEALAELNAIVHPAVAAEIDRRLAALAETDEVVILDVPLLVEAAAAGRARAGPAGGGSGPAVGGRPGGGAYPYGVAGVIVVDVDPEVAVARLAQQRGMAERDVRARMARQASREQRLARADRVIDNSGSLADLHHQVDAAWRWITTLKG